MRGRPTLTYPSAPASLSPARRGSFFLGGRLSWRPLRATQSIWHAHHALAPALHLVTVDAASELALELASSTNGVMSRVIASPGCEPGSPERK